MKADKGGGVAIMNKSKYLEKYLPYVIVNNLYDLMKILQKLMKRSYKKCFLKSSSSAPGKFYGTEKLHKISINDGVDKLSIRPIISNIGTPTYHLAKYLAKLFSPLANSQYTVTSTKDFNEKNKESKGSRWSSIYFI